MICNICSHDKDLTEFHKHPKLKSGYFPTCKVCTRERDRSYYAALSPEAKRNRVLQRYYKMTVEDYDRLLEAQDYGCAACGESAPEGKYLKVDHDHACCPGAFTCGKCVRGLLCNACNSMLGHLENGRVEKLTAYLESI